MSNTDTEYNFIDINRGFRRMGNFPAFTDEVFKSYTEASEYAMSGRYGGSSYIGQMIRVIPDNDLDDPTIYVVNSNYTLQTATEHVTINDNLSIQFSFGMPGKQIYLPEGYIINNITIKITEAFRNDNAIKIISYPFNAPSNKTILIASGPEYTYLDNEKPDNLILTDEDGDEFTFNVSKIVNERTIIEIELNTVGDPHLKGKGFLKIN